MTSLATDVAAALAAGGYTGIRAYRFDSSTMDQICVIPGGGRNHLVASADGGGANDIPAPNVQIQVRDNDMATAESRALAIIALLHRGTVTGCIALTWDGRAPDYWLDDNGLHIFAIEFSCLRSGGA